MEEPPSLHHREDHPADESSTGRASVDLGCGSGWATRLLARLVADGPEGLRTVLWDSMFSDEMIRLARAARRILRT